MGMRERASVDRTYCSPARHGQFWRSQSCSDSTEVAKRGLDTGPECRTSLYAVVFMARLDCQMRGQSTRLMGLTSHLAGRRGMANPDFSSLERQNSDVPIASRLSDPRIECSPPLQSP